MLVPALERLFLNHPSQVLRRISFRICQSLVGKAPMTYQIKVNGQERTVDADGLRAETGGVNRIPRKHGGAG